MSHAKPQHRSSWLDTVAGLLDKKEQRPRATRRRLVAERLESRLNLSVATVTHEPESTGLTLTEYLAEVHEMGPTNQTFADASGDGAGNTAPSTAQPTGGPQQAAALTDQALANFGMAEGEGGGSGSGSGSGSGAGSGSGSGSGGSTDTQPPEVSDMHTSNDGSLSGIISDNSGTGGLSGVLDGPGTLTINEDGSFTIDMSGVQGSGTGSVTIFDASGNSTTIVYTF